MVRYLMGLQTYSICGEPGIMTWCENNSILSFYAEQSLSLDFIWYRPFYFFFPVHVSPSLLSLVSLVEQERHLLTVFCYKSPHCLGKYTISSIVNWKNKKNLSSTDLSLFLAPQFFPFITTTLLQPYIPAILHPFHFYYRSFKIVLGYGIVQNTNLAREKEIGLGEKNDTERERKNIMETEV